MSQNIDQPPTQPTAGAAPDPVGLHISGAGVATITLQTPENRNALSVRLRRSLGGHLDAAIANTAVRVIVLTGSGPAFCAGADLKEGPIDVPKTPTLPALLTQIMEGPKPVLCVLNGPARAGGIGLVAACDVAIAPDTCTFAFSEVRIGVVPAIISVPCLARLTPRAASRYFLTGETFGAADAVEAGLLTIAASPDELPALARELVDALLLGAPAALAGTKGVLRQVPTMGRDEAFSYAEKVSAEFFASADAVEGRRAFAEGRPPIWGV